MRVLYFVILIVWKTNWDAWFFTVAAFNENNKVKNTHTLPPSRWDRIKFIYKTFKKRPWNVEERCASYREVILDKNPLLGYWKVSVSGKCSTYGVPVLREFTTYLKGFENICDKLLTLFNEIFLQDFMDFLPHHYHFYCKCSRSPWKERGLGPNVSCFWRL